MRTKSRCCLFGALLHLPWSWVLHFFTGSKCMSSTEQKQGHSKIWSISKQSQSKTLQSMQKCRRPDEMIVNPFQICITSHYQRVFVFGTGLRQFQPLLMSKFSHYTYIILTVSSPELMNKLILLLFFTLLTFGKRNRRLDRAKQAYNNYYTSKQFEQFS